MLMVTEEGEKPLVLLTWLRTMNVFPDLRLFYFWPQLEYERRKKEEGKRARGEKPQVLDMLFSAFEKHQYYNIKDLVDITKQPVVRCVSTSNSLSMWTQSSTLWSLKTSRRKLFSCANCWLNHWFMENNIHLLPIFLFSDIPKGNPAWHWPLQREGNTQEHLGAQTRIQTLPRGGKDWRIEDVPPSYFERRWPSQYVLVSGFFFFQPKQQWMSSSAGCDSVRLHLVIL